MGCQQQLAVTMDSLFPVFQQKKKHTEKQKHPDREKWGNNAWNYKVFLFGVFVQM